LNRGYLNALIQLAKIVAVCHRELPIASKCRRAPATSLIRILVICRLCGAAGASKKCLPLVA
jgi:hypothetical protein